MYLICGLGNPGKKYEETRHNVGFMAIDIISQKLGTTINKVKFKGLIGDANYNGKKILLLKPQTYMNLSGQSVVDVVNFYKIPLEKILLIYDDMDLPEGKIRVRPRGGSGGHKGMESVIYHLSSEEFCRIRIGIGKPEEKHDTVGHVLGKIDNLDEQKKILPAIKAASEAALTIIEYDVETAMNKYNNFEI
ncbi:MAG TPA: aminoacyl-tRNA hydrolase [Thermoanaerobacterales bacterium]|jgi:PTH1 family peptidyl-tRNA hydrolase|nr:aminoacyl-tRNA hydrolase [Thermoanaerobacterales bacterium]